MANQMIAGHALSPTTLQALWDTFGIQLSPMNTIIHIPGFLFRVMDNRTKDRIAQKAQYVSRFPRIFSRCEANISRAQMSMEFMYCRDGTHVDRYLLGPVSTFCSEQYALLDIVGELPVLMPPPVSPQDEPAGPVGNDEQADRKIPRPPNAYILYRKDRHQEVKDANPGITNNEICECTPVSLEFVMSNLFQRSSSVRGGGPSCLESELNTTTWLQRSRQSFYDLILTTNTAPESVARKSAE